MKRKTIAGLIVIVVIALVAIFAGCVERETPVSTPTPIPDSDGDGWNDEQEKIAGTDPDKKDTDDDGYWDPNDPNPLNPNIPVSTITPTPPPTKIQTPKTIYVDDDFKDEQVNHRWNTIQEGIMDARDGDIIIVYEGIYHETVDVDKSVILKGTDHPVIDARQNGNVLRITADNCEVSGFKLINSGDVWPNSGFSIYSNSNTIEDNIVFSNYCGISMWNSSNNILSENKVSNSGWEGIYLEHSSNNEITKNTISNSKARGILICDTSINNTISINDISNNHRGISIADSLNNKIIENSIHNNEDGIQISRSRDNILSENNVRSNHNNGISLIESVDNKIIKNIVLDNYGTGISICDSSNTLVYYNNLDNDLNGVDDTNSNFWDNGDEGNYWSDYRGNDMDGDEIGDTPYLIPGIGKATDNYPLMNPIV
ncbi:MAG TPA: NosD domain-containing protein [Desulfobacteria bacterium]|nr:NosD domain-containing protein [Desulfobacteria bacterium]